MIGRTFFDNVRVVEPGSWRTVRLAVSEVPLARHQCVVAGITQQRRQFPDTLGQRSAVRFENRSEGVRCRRQLPTDAGNVTIVSGQ